MEGVRRKGLTGGLLGVWLSSLVYGLLYAVGHGGVGGPRLVFSLVALSLVFPLSFLAWLRPGARLPLMVLGVSLVAPVALWGLPGSGPLVLVEALLLFVVFMARGASLIMAGGALVGGVGGFLAALAGGPVEAVLLPLAYHVVSVSKATYRVTGVEGYARLYVAGTLAAALLGAGLYRWCLACGAVLHADLLARLVETLAGLDRRLSVRAYGVLETVRILVVLGLLGWHLGSSV